MAITFNVHLPRILLALVIGNFFWLTEGNQRLCGSSLRVALEVICDNKYNTLHYNYELSITKNNNLNTDTNNELVVDHEQEFEARVRKKRQGAVDECCRRPCSVTELKKYCSAPENNSDEE